MCRIQAQDASFDCKELEALIAAQLADARCTENALLQAQLGAGGDTAALASAAAAAVIAPAPLGLAAAAVVVVKPKRVSKPKLSVAPKTAEKMVKKTTGGHPSTAPAASAGGAGGAVSSGTTGTTGFTGITATGTAMNSVPAILTPMPMVVPLSVPLSVPAPVSTLPMSAPVPVAAQRVSGPPASAPAPTAAAEPAVSSLTSVPEVV